ncbi:orotidine-5'-phosphate decarboxylase [Natranaerofaba carboxydovora]|uniref:orotidine-5'-phosphate decarboxylase n=1 Tax=Natranaerofaba carboxydovora TaxID=2742683 RepID=UPI001F143559|nr:orotidine-5'-phosphate decarboxylase [Natranaerofaba carboxydovora]UMZ73870.1 Orotidine 5'-phosphate decarboxylase [Natranaerofaba carboxydovora]
MGDIKMDLKDRIIVALDTSSVKESKSLIDALDDDVINYKVGLEQYLASDGKMVDTLNERKKNVFLDLKFHDIPNTVNAAAREAVKKGVWMFNIHVTAIETMQQAVLATKEEAEKLNVKKPYLIGVTVLTSMTKKDLEDIGGYKGYTDELVLKKANLAKEAGLDGVVASPREVKVIKENCGEDFTVVCPGIRPIWSQSNDQKRIMTPKEAFQDGADFLVIGRPITKASKPKEAVSKILDEFK